MAHGLHGTDRADDVRTSIESLDKDERHCMRVPWTIKDSNDRDWLFDGQAVDAWHGVEYPNDHEKSALHRARKLHRWGRKHAQSLLTR